MCWRLEQHIASHFMKKIGASGPESPKFRTKQNSRQVGRLLCDREQLERRLRADGKDKSQPWTTEGLLCHRQTLTESFCWTMHREHAQWLTCYVQMEENFVHRVGGVCV